MSEINISKLIDNMGKTILKSKERIIELQKENEELHKINKANAKSYEKFWYKLEKYKQTLKEIKEIAKNGCYDDCGMPLDEFSIILQKISEVFDVRI